MEDLITIEGFLRKETGKGFCRKLRKANRVPANILGVSREESMIELDSKWLSKAWLGGKKFNLKIGDSLKAVEIKELQISAVKREALHVDLKAI